VANNSAAQNNAAQQLGSQLISEETFQVTQAALRAQANFAGEMQAAIMRDIEEATVRAQGDRFKVLQSGLAQLRQDSLILQAESDRLGRIAQILVARAHSDERPRHDRTKIKSKVKSLAQEVIEAANASPVAVAIANIASNVVEREDRTTDGGTFLALSRSDTIDACIVGGAIGGAVIGGIAGGVGGAIAGAVIGGIVGGGACFLGTK